MIISSLVFLSLVSTVLVAEYFMNSNGYVFMEYVRTILVASIMTGCIYLRNKLNERSDALATTWYPIYSEIIPALLMSAFFGLAIT